MLDTEKMRPYAEIIGKLHATQIMLNELQFKVTELMSTQLTLPSESIAAIVNHINKEKGI